MTKTRLHRSKRGQVVCLPNDAAFPEGVSSVTVLHDGKRRVLVPSNATWDDFFDAPGADLGDRIQPVLPDDRT